MLYVLKMKLDIGTAQTTTLKKVLARTAEVAKEAKYSASDCCYKS